MKGSPENNTINVIATHNQALWGAGLIVDVLDSAKNNRVILKHVHFSHNSCTVDARTEGGAIKIHYFPKTESPSNIFITIDSIFDSDSVYYGGGISLSTNRERGVLVATNGITMRGCVW